MSIKRWLSIFAAIAVMVVLMVLVIPTELHWYEGISKEQMIDLNGQPDIVVPKTEQNEKRFAVAPEATEAWLYFSGSLLSSKQPHFVFLFDKEGRGLARDYCTDKWW